MTTLPTIKQLFDSILNNLEAEFSIAINPFGKAFLVALAGVLSGCLYLYYLTIGDVQKNIWVDTADSVANGGTLERFGNIILGRYPFAAQPGTYTVSVTGTAGAVIDGTAVFKSDDSSESPGMLFQIVAGAYTLTGSADVINIVALKGGASSQLAIGDTLTVTSPIINVNSGVAVTIVVQDPIDAETTEDYRTKIIEKIQLEPGSWSAVDYRLVGTGIAGVGQTYAYAKSGSSAEVNVFLQGTTPVANPGPSVSSTVLTNYQNALELVRPLGVFLVHYASCPINNIDITITRGSFIAFTTAQQALILSALTAFVNSVHPFIASCDNVVNKNDTIALYNLNATIAAAVPGYGFASVAFTVASVSETTWTADNGNIPFLNSITYA